eukprot:1790671-Rhodomonas_salina.3
MRCVVPSRTSDHEAAMGCAVLKYRMGLPGCELQQHRRRLHEAGPDTAGVGAPDQRVFDPGQRSVNVYTLSPMHLLTYVVQRTALADAHPHVLATVKNIGAAHIARGDPPKALHYLKNPTRSPQPSTLEPKP